MKKNDLLKVYRDLLSLDNQEFLIELGVAALNETVQVFERKKLVRREEPARADRFPELASMARGFQRRFKSTRDQGDVPFRRLAASFQRDLGGCTDDEDLRARCQELPILYSYLCEHWNGIKHRREAPSVSQVLNLSSSIQRVWELAPRAVRRERAKDSESLRQQCALAQERCRPANDGSEAGSGRSSPSRSGFLAVDFPARAENPVARISLRRVKTAPPVEFQIDSVDGSFTTGRQRLDGERDVEVRLAWHGENRFQVWTFDASRGLIHSEGPFGIVRTEAPPRALTAARSLLLSVAGPAGETVSEWLVRKGDPLPVERHRAFRIDAQGGLDPATPSITVCESDRHDAEGGLRPLGRVWLAPEHFPVRRMDSEVEIRCDYKVADPGHLRLSISVAGAPPEARLTRTVAYSQGDAAESPAEELDRESRGAFHQSAQELELIEDFLQSSHELPDPGSERNSHLTETEELLYRLQVKLSEMARRILGIEPSQTIVPLDEWLGGGGDFDFVGAKERRILMASPEYVTLLKEAAATAQTTEFVREVLPACGCWPALRFRELLGRLNGVSPSLADGPLDRSAFLGCIEAGYRALRDADLDRLQSVLGEMSKLLPDSFCREMVLPEHVERPAAGSSAARWLPLHWEVDGCAAGRMVDEGQRWQRYETFPGHVVVVTRELADWWVERGLLEETTLIRLEVGDSEYAGVPDGWVTEDDDLVVVGGVGIGPIAQYTPDGFGLARRLARSIVESRRYTDASFHDAIYSARFGRVLPTLSGTPGQTDDVVLGCCLAGGLHVPASSMERMKELTTLDEDEIRQVLQVAGIPVANADATTRAISSGPSTKDPAERPTTFRLPGRPALETLFNEEIIEAAWLAEQDPERIPWPGGVVLHGPPGCGKTFAVERLTAFLGWEVFRINSRAVGSPYIHETSRKVAEVFEKAREVAPSVIVIDEMEAFLSARQSGVSSGQPHLEEVAEFLRRIGEAPSQRILVLGMTNRLDLIDSAFLRTGRFDHIEEVGMPTAAQVESVLREALRDVELASAATLVPTIKELLGRPLSDLDYLVKRLKRELAKANQNQREWVMDDALLREGIAQLRKRRPMRKRSGIGFRPDAP